ncbi:MAG: DUF4080 domain-containing protein [Kouleothrix sp.]|nr:DUF4080 domain-containing protein [Kouleothrix sp.]
MHRLRVLLAQLPVPNNPATNVPLAAGYLKAYAQARGLLDRVEIEILPRALADHAGDALLVDAIVERRPDVLGLSLYTWSSERSLAIAERARALLPGLLVVVGGPEVQHDNDWLLRHPAVDVAVFGEGEQTFAELLALLADDRRPQAPPLNHPVTRSPGHLTTIGHLAAIRGIVFRDESGDLIVTGERVALADLAPLPSPYLLGYLEPGPIMMVEISRWCPYACAFCLYGRNMGPKLGSRYFPLERILAEVRWGRERGATQIHFVEANLNLVPVFRPLMAALAEMNADGALALYAELRGEHLADEAVDALARAGLRVAEVGLQTANPVALAAAHRRTDLQKWAAGTRRLARRGVEIYLDVILGLPADDAAGAAETLDFIRREELGAYDVFTLQVLPGTETRRQAAEYGLTFQERPPYYILGTDRLSYGELRRLRRDLKLGAGLDPDEVEGCPPPRPDALDDQGRTTKDQAYTTGDRRREPVSEHVPQAPSPKPQAPDRLPLVRPVTLPPGHLVTPIERLWLLERDEATWTATGASIGRLARHVDVVACWEDAARLSGLLAQAIDANPSALFDCYLLAEEPPPPAALAAWRAALPYQPGYLDRVAVYRRAAPDPAHERVSPRLWLVLPWTAQAEPARYRGAAELIWRYELDDGEEPPLGAWRSAGGAGVWARGLAEAQVAELRERSGLRLWSGG